MRWIFGAIALAIAMLAGSVHAQPNIAALQATDAVARGLAAQYEAALIRERRLADAREQQLIADYETTMRTLRARVDRGDQDAQAQLAESRTQFAAYVASIAARDSTAIELVAAYRTQVTLEIAQASPEQIAALQRFADGDLQAGFEQYAAESARRAAARQRQIRAAAEAAAQAARAADAADARQLARLGTTMWLRGQKTLPEILTLWDRASELDPNDFETEIYRAQLVARSGDLARAQTLAEHAQMIARDDDDRISANAVLRALALDRDDWGAVERLDVQYTAILRRRADADPNNFDAEVAARLSEIRQQSLDGDHASVQIASEALLGTVRLRLAADPQSRALQLRLKDVLVRLSWEQRMQGDPVGELASLTEAAATARRVSNANASDIEAQEQLSYVLRLLAEAQIGWGDRAGGRASFEERVAIARRRHEADPGNMVVRQELSVSLYHLSGALPDAEALPVLTESLTLARSVAAAAPSDASLLVIVWVSMRRLISLGNSGVTWAQLLTEMEDAERRGMLLPADRPLLDEARRRAR